MRYTIVAVLSAMAMLAVMGCSNDPDSPSSSLTGPSEILPPAGVVEPVENSEEWLWKRNNTIYDVAKAASQAPTPEFTILVAALEATGLDRVLDGWLLQYTVFAPTDAAFNRLFSNPDFPYTPEELLANKELLKTVLLYHTALFERKAERVVASPRIRMIKGGYTYPEVNGGVFLRDTSDLTQTAEIIKTDIDASNGVIHVIDEVLLP